MPNTADSIRIAAGPFDVKLEPLPSEAHPDGWTLGRRSIDKRFHGDLEATSRGEMLSAGAGVKGSAGYVAIEHVTGTLIGRRGTFVLQHHGIMNRGAGELTITVVPDSATGELEGLTGTMSITIAPGGAHSYEFRYVLDDGA